MSHNRDASHESLPGEVLEALRGGRKIEAIKLLREARGIGLREAKDAVEAANIQQIPQTPGSTQTVRRGGAGGLQKLVLLLVVIGLAVAAYVYLKGPAS